MPKPLASGLMTAALLLAPALLAPALVASPAAAQTAPQAPPAAAATEPLKLFGQSKLIVGDHITIEVIGRGPDVVLIPGLASSKATWKRTAERLSGRYRLHLVQVAGFAGEPARANATGPVFDPVHAAIDAYAASLGKPIIVGHSLGGTLGLALAQQHPDHLSKLMIVDALPWFGAVMGGPGATPASLKPMTDGMRRATGGMSEGQSRQMMATMATAPADVEMITAWGRASNTSTVVNAMADDIMLDLTPGLAAVRIPVTVVYEAPLETPIQTGYSTLATKTLVVVPGSKHFIMFDQPEAFDRALDAFLAR